MLKLTWSSSHKLSTSLLQIYQQRVKAQGLSFDEKQVNIISDLQRLHDDLTKTHQSWKQQVSSLIHQQFAEPRPKIIVQQKQEKRKGFFSFFSSEFSTSKGIRVPGLYLYGGSGIGKTFLCDIFYNNLLIEEKRKTHFHEFMASIHAELFQLQKQKKGYDPVVQVAKSTAKKTRLLYLDQFQVTDVADASILSRLFEKLISNELVLLATTNRPPDDLYKDGHQREFFLPFIDFIKDTCVVRNGDSTKDYRYELEKDLKSSHKTYMYPINEKSEAEVKKLIHFLTGQKSPVFTEKILQPIAGRNLVVHKAFNLVCMYDFTELMEGTMGDSDFRVICKNFKAIIIRRMRKIKREERNIANRLIKLFDEAYFRNVHMYIEAEVDMEELITPLPQKQATTEQDFAMIRCKSRLMQFQTISYKQKLSYAQQRVQKQKAALRQQPKPTPQ